MRVGETVSVGVGVPVGRTVVVGEGRSDSGMVVAVDWSLRVGSVSDTKLAVAVGGQTSGRMTLGHRLFFTSSTDAAMTSRMIRPTVTVR